MMSGSKNYIVGKINENLVAKKSLHNLRGIMCGKIIKVNTFLTFVI
jgi:hypothetical protein